jgi:hypothetical protein
MVIEGRAYLRTSMIDGSVWRRLGCGAVLVTVKVTIVAAAV